MRIIAVLMVMVLPWVTGTSSFSPCDDGWVLGPDDKFCYLFNTKWNTFNNAEKDCQTKGAHLASIHSAKEVEFLRSQTRDFARFWIGLHRQNSKDFVWTDESKVDFTNWSKSQPYYGSIRKCVRAAGDLFSFREGKWDEVGCDWHQQAVCKKLAKKIKPEVKESSKGTCDDGWKLGPDEKYCYLFTGRRSLSGFNDAEQYCQSQGAHLPSVHSAKEEQFLRKLAEFDSFWIGLNRQSASLYFIWTDRSKVDFENWAKRQPDNYGFKNCVRTISSWFSFDEIFQKAHDWSTDKGKWRNEKCASIAKAICKKPATIG